MSTKSVVLLVAIQRFFVILRRAPAPHPRDAGKLPSPQTGA
jgi:hypothetical protein